MKKILLILVFVLLTILPTTLAFATSIPNPDIAAPAVTSVDVYENYLALGDVLVVANYYIKYTTPPTLTIDQTMIGRFMNGAVEMANVAPYSYFDNGYEHGVFSFYFPVGSTPTWLGAGYSVQFNGSPTITWTGGPNPPTSSTNSFTWHTTTTVAANSAILGANVIYWATSLGNFWSVALTTQSSNGVRLSSYGDQYFSNAIPNLRTACPQIFIAASIIINPVQSVPPTTPGSSTMGGTWPYSTSSTVKYLIFVIVEGCLLWAVGLKVHRMDLGILIAGSTMPLMGRIGLIPVSVVIGGAILCILALGFTLILQRGAS